MILAAKFHHFLASKSRAGQTFHPKGTGCVCFKTPEDAQLALALNESKLGQGALDPGSHA
jgi:hypothetical protein